MDEEDQYNAEASGSQTAETPAVATASSLEAGEPKLSKNQQKKAARQVGSSMELDCGHSYHDQLHALIADMLLSV